MNKKKFITVLEEKLRLSNYKDIDNVLEYYEELISERVEAGEKETEVIKSFGTISNLLKRLDVEEKIEIANEKPTVSNGIKVLIATLGLFSLPLLIPAIIVAFTFIFVAIVMLVSFGIVALALAFSAVVAVFAIIGSIIIGRLPFFSGLFALGLVLVLGAFSMELMKFLIRITQSLVIWFVNKTKEQLNKIRGDK